MSAYKKKEHHPVEYTLLFAITHSDQTLAVGIPCDIGDLVGNGANLVFENMLLVRGIPDAHVALGIYTSVSVHRT